MVANEYEKQGLDFLAKHSITFSSALIGNDCPPFCEDARNGKDMDLVDKFPRRSHIHGKHYRITFSADKRKPFTFDFWNCYADEEYNHVVANFTKWDIGPGTSVHSFLHKYKAELSVVKGRKKRVPTPYDVLTCLTKNDPGTFDDFCSEYGFDNDSIRARTTWEAVVEEWRKVKAFFTDEELTEAQEIQ